jgi:predicted RNA-binding Zn-ribbon protein involved in translation (DUF1610 family)
MSNSNTESLRKTKLGDLPEGRIWPSSRWVLHLEIIEFLCMTVRNPVVCISCDSKIITRTQIGHKDMQKHSFPCPTCGVVITYILDLDQEKVSFKFRDPENGKWADDEDGAVKTLTFSDEIVVPASMPDFISPHIATWGRYDWEKCREDEGLRQLFVRKTFQYAERCRVHFERGSWDLFDKESPSHHEGPVTPKSRLIDLYNFYTAGFSKFTLIPRGKYDRIHQRLTCAKTLDQTLVNDLAEHYLASGRIVSLWKEIFSVRNSFVNCYSFVQPLITVKYWKEECREPVSLSDKRFNELRQLYIDCFETLFRLLVLAMGFEVIIHHRKLEIPTKKGSMTLEQFEQMANATKRDHIAKFPIEDLFMPVLDTDFRNGIGHHAAHYEQEHDAIVIFDTRDAGTVNRVVGYTEFCEKVLDLFAAFELAAMYHHDLHIYLGGRFA